MAAKKAAVSMNDGFDVGDVLVSQWGYEQTNTDFYIVLDRTAKTIVIQEIGSRRSESIGPMSGYVVPDKSRIRSAPMRRRVNTAYKAVSISSFANAYPWKGKPEYESSYY